MAYRYLADDEKDVGKFGFSLWKLICVVCIVCGTLFPAAYTYALSKGIIVQPTDEPQPGPVKPDPVIVDPDKPVVEPTKNYQNDFYYQFLTKEEKEVYKDIMKAFSEYQTTVSLTNSIPVDEMRAAVNAFRNDNPLYYWISGDNGYTHISDLLGNVSTVSFGYKGNEKSTIELLESKADRIIASMPEGSEYDKAKYLHDYLIKNTEYDDNATDNQNILSVFMNGRTVCAGYTRAYQYLCNKAGLFCTYVSGYATNSLGGKENHAWNLIRIDNRYYWVDVTWDDPIGNTQNRMIYDYFCLDDADIGMDHIIDMTDDFNGLNITIPSCSDKSMEYYNLRNAYYDTYNVDDIDQYLKKYGNEGLMEIRFSSIEEMNKAVDDLITNGKVRALLKNNGIDVGTFTYSIKDKFHIIVIYYQ